MDIRKQTEAEFHNRWRDENLRKDQSEDRRMSFSKRFYSITRGSFDFLWGNVLEQGSRNRILDYCCGDGDLSLFLARRGAEVVGIDISDVSIERAKRQAQQEGVANVSFFVMDAENMELEDNSFDVVLCCGVLHHLDVTRAYPELMRVLRPDGKVVCDEPLAYNPAIQLYRRMTMHLRTSWEAKHILRKREIDVSRIYFGRVETRFFHLFTLLAVPFRHSARFDAILGFLEKVDSVALRLPLVKWLSWQVIFILSEPKK